MGERRGAYRALVGKPEGRRPLGRPRHRWEDNIKMDLREVGCGGADWINLAQDRDRWRALMYMVMNLRVPQNAGNFLSSLGHFSFSGRTLLHGVSYIVQHRQLVKIIFLETVRQDEIKERIILGNKAYHANQALFKSKLLSKKINKKYTGRW
jgi:hypothetical protein